MFYWTNIKLITDESLSYIPDRVYINKTKSIQQGRCLHMATVDPFTIVKYVT